MVISPSVITALKSLRKGNSGSKASVDHRQTRPCLKGKRREGEGKRGRGEGESGRDDGGTEGGKGGKSWMLNYLLGLISS